MLVRSISVILEVRKKLPTMEDCDLCGVAVGTVGIDKKGVHVTIHTEAESGEV